ALPSATPAREADWPAVPCASAPAPGSAHTTRPSHDRATLRFHPVAAAAAKFPPGAPAWRGAPAPPRARSARTCAPLRTWALRIVRLQQPWFYNLRSQFLQHFIDSLQQLPGAERLAQHAQ